ncbi:Ig-like domain-containing protein [Chitinibacter sp. SCUT-21]|uniref:Calx-beta domain-containing protein n=1 Tax=Chitinibacter sp. SCUT-21 TaxID=2970891 RepID=UPI0035A72CF4
MAETIITGSDTQKGNNTIVVVAGEAFIRDASGKVTPIAAGDQLQEGQVIFTSATGHVTLMLPNGQVIELGADRNLLLDGDLAGTQATDATEAKVANAAESADQIINALNQGKDLSDELEATAAGLNGAGGEGEGSGFVRLLRIAENVDPVSFEFASAAEPIDPFVPVVAEAAPQIDEPVANQKPDFVGSNGSPLGDNVSVTTPEDTPVSGRLAAVDADGDTLTFGKVSEPIHGSVSVQADGSWTYTPNKDYNGSDSFKVQVSDGKGGVDTLTVNIGVTPVNDAPDAIDDSTNTNINTPVVNINVLGNDKDIDGDTLSVTRAELQDPSKGSVSINADGTLNFTPATNVLGPVVINYTISDGKGGTDTAQLTINVSDVPTPPISKIEVGQPGPQDDSVVEGNKLVFNVTISAASPKAESYSFNLGGGSAAEVDFERVNLSFSNGVTYDAATGKITVPAGVTSFSVTLPTVDDTLVESGETVPLNIGGISATGNIVDNDTQGITIVGAGNGTGTGDTVVFEGSAAVFTVKLDAAASSDTTVKLSLTTAGGAGQASAGDVGALEYFNGSSWTPVVNGQVTIPAGSTSVQVRVPTTVDSVFEGAENFTLNATVTGVGAASGTGTIVDDGRTGPTPPTGTPDDDRPHVSITGVSDGKEAGQVGIVYSLKLDHMSTTATTVTLDLKNGSATLGTDTGAVEVSFDGGKTYVAVSGNSISVPANTTDVLVRVAVTDDALVEGTENITLAVKGQYDSAFTAPVSGNIVDNDTQGITIVGAGNGTGTGDTVVFEGSAAVFTVKLDAAASSDTTVKLSLTTAGGAGQASAGDVGALEYFNGSSWTPVVNGQVTIPAGSTSVQVRVPTTVDSVFEGAENFTLNATVTGVGAASGTGTIVDDGRTGPTPPTGTPDDDRPHVSITGVSDGKEAGQVGIVYSLKLDHMSTTATTVTLDLKNGSATLGTDTGAVEVSFDGGKTYVAVSGNSISVPANTTDVLVRVAVTDDALVEGTENITLAVKGQYDSAFTAPVSGNIVDNDTQGITIVGAGNGTGTGDTVVFEGSAAVFTVKLDAAASSDTTVKLSLTTAGGAGQASAGDVGALEYFNGSSWTPVVNGQVTIPAGSTSVQVRVPTTVDSVFEGAENFTLNATVTGVGAASGTGTIVDDGRTGPTPPTGTPDDDRPHVSITGVSDGKEAGQVGIVYSLKLDHMSTTATTVTLDLKNGSATLGTDTGAVEVSFDGGKTYVAVSGNSISVPANTTDVLVRVAVTDDALVEGTENITLAVKGQYDSAFTAPVSGNIVDNDTQGITIVGAGNGTGTGDTVVFEGSAAVFTVKLDAAASSDTTVKLSLTTAGGAGQASAGDVGALEYFNGSSWTPVVNGQVTIPAGSTSVQVRVPTTVDSVFEGAENFTLNATVTGVGAASGTGTIVDDGRTGPTPPTGTPDDDRPHVSITGVSDGKEAGQVGIVYSLKLDHMSTTATTVTLDLKNGSATLGTDTGAVEVSFDGGKTYVAVSGNSISVPANTTDVLVRVAVTDDALVEGTENITLAVKGQYDSAFTAPVSGNIVDNDTQGITIVGAGNGTGTGDTVVFEGSAAVFTVKLDAAASSDTTVKLSLTTAGGAGQASAGDVGALEYFNGSSWTPVVNGQVTIPAGSTSVQVRVPTTVDSVFEGAENFTLNATVTGVGAASGTGTIVDDGRTGPTPPTGTPDDDRPHVSITGVSDGKEAGQVGIVYSLKLDHMSTTATTVTLDLKNGSATLGTDTGAVEVSFDGGKTYVAVSGNSISVPANTTDVLVRVAVTDDALVEGTENITLAVKGQYDSAFTAPVSGNIVDNDTQGITIVGAGNGTGTGDTVVFEGSAAVFTVKLDAAASSDTTVKLSLTTAGGAGQASAGDVGALEYFNGSSWTPVVNGQVTIPAGSTSVQVRVPTTVDSVFEGAENFTLNATVTGVGAASGTGTIVDDGRTGPTPPTGTPDDDRPHVSITGVSDGKEAGQVGIVYSLKLDHMSTTATTVTLDLKNGSATLGTDTGAVEVSFDGGKTYVAVSGNSISVPANTTDVLVRVAVTDDALVEGTENITLAVKGQYDSAFTAPVSGNIVDNDTQGITIVGAGNGTGTGDTVVFEGSAAVFTVKLDAAASSDTTVKLSLTTAGGAGQASAGDVGALEYFNGSSWTPVVNGQVTIPAGSTSVQVRVPTTVDSVFEGAENFTLNATVTGVGAASGTGTIVDDGRTGPTPPTGTPDDDRPHVSITGVSDGKEAGQVGIVYSLKLDHMSTTATTVTLDLKNGSATLGTDTGAVEVSFDGGKTYVAVSGNSISVPANTTDVLVRVAVTDDALVEGTENITLAVKGQYDSAFTAPVSGNIVDNDTQGITIVGAGNGTGTGDTVVFEGSAAVFTVKLDAAASSDTTVKLSLTTAGGAGQASAGDVGALEYFNGSSWTPVVNGQVTIPAGSTSVQVRVPTTVDSVFEGAENFTLNATVTGVGAASGTGTIVDDGRTGPTPPTGTPDDDRPHVSITGVSDGKEAGQVGIVYSLKLDHMSTTATTVTLDLKNGSATLGTDTGAVEVSFDGGKTYVAVSGNSISVPANTTDVLVRVAVTDDALVEGTENITLAVKGQYDSAFTAPVSGNIVDNDTQGITIVGAGNGTGTGDTVVFEGSAAVFTVKLDAAASSDTTVKLSLTTAGGAGQASAGDVGALEYFNGSSWTPVVNGQVTIPAGSTSVQVRVPTTVDSVFEGAENFTLNATVTGVGAASGTGTIVDDGRTGPTPPTGTPDDDRPHVSITGVSDGKEAGQVGIVYSLKLDHMSTTATTVTLDLKNGSATLGTDTGAVEVSFDGGKTYVAVSGNSISVPANTTDVLVRVAVTDDALVEGTENITLAVKGQYDSAFTAPVSGNIVDNDTQGITIVGAGNGTGTGDTVVFEGSAAVFTVKLDAAASSDTTVKLSLTTAGGAGQASAGDVGALEYFNGSSWTPVVNGQVTIPAGSTSVQVRVPTTVDSVFEGAENFTLNATVTGVGAASGTGTIVDDGRTGPTPPTGTPDDDRPHVSITGVSDGKEAGQVGIVYSLKLDHMSTTATTVTLDLKNGSATLGTDTGAVEVSFDGGKTYVAVSGNSISVPANTTDVLVRVAVTDDALVEGTENITLAVKGQYDSAFTAPVSGNIVDNDTQGITIVGAGNGTGTGDTVVFEGSAAVFTVKLDAAASSDTTVKLSLTTAGGAGQASAGDVGALEYFNGSSWTPVVNGQVTIPAGSTSVQVRVPTTVDSVFEGAENFTLNATVTGVGAASGTGTIVDDGRTGPTPPTGTPDDDRPHVSITGVSDGKEAGQVGIVYSLKLDHMSTTATTVTLDLKNGSATLGTDTGAVEVSFDGGKTYVAVSGNSISVPANTTDVLVRVAVTDDALVEGTENITLAVKGQYDSAFTAPVSGNIVDNDTQGITIVGAGNGTGTGDTVVFEGSAAVFTVKLDAAASSDTTVKLSLTTAGGAGQASAGDVGALEYFNGSSWTPVVNGQVTIPAGSTSVQVRVPTTVDSVFEGAENFTLNATVTGVGAASGTGTIVDDGRTGPTPPTGTPDDDRPHVSITGVSDGKEAGQVGIVYSLKLDHMSTTATTVTLDLKNGSATLGTDTGAVEVSFDGGKTYVAVSGNSISVPANTTDVLVRVAVTDDALVEGTENITLAVKGQYDSAFTAPVSGNIVDNDTQGITIVGAGNGTGTGDTVVFEGSAAVFTVKLDAAASSDTTVKLSLTTAGGAGQASAGDVGALEYFNGSSWTPVVNGQVTIPAGSTSVQVRVPTTVDSVFEGAENFTLNATVTGVGAASGTGTIVDDGRTGPTPPTGTPDDDRPHVSITGVSDGKEAGQVGIVYSLKLDHMSTTATTVTLDLKNGSATLGTDTGAVEVSFDGGKTYVAVSGNSISVPANTTDVLVRVAVTDDALVEGTENITLAVKGQYDSAFTAPVSGNIVDNDTQGITIVGAGNGTGTGDTVVFEGSAAVFTVKLDAAASSDTTVKLSLTTAGGAGQASAGDVGALEYFNGSSWTPVVNGQVTIPAGSTSVQVRVPTTVDSVFEGAENFTLNATVTGVGAASGTGTIVDDGRTGPTPPTGTPDDDRPHVSITGVSDGKEAGQVGIVYSLKLDHMSTTATTVTLDLKNGSATLGTDTGAVEVSFDGGKTYVAVSGNSISVPANTTDVLVRVAVTDDALVEGTENITLAVKGQYDSAFTAPVSGNIVDNDTQGITIVGAGNGTGTGDTVVFEGSAAVFTVKLDAAASSDTTVKLSLTTAGGAGQASAGDVGALEYFNGSSWTPVVNGQVTIPAGSTSVQVRVPTTVDSVFEGAENFTLNATVTGVGAASGTGTIVDDGRTGPTPPTGTPDDDRPHVSITGVSDGKEAGQVGIVYSLKLDHMSTTATTVTLDLKNGSATLGTDTGAVEVSFDGGKTYVAVSGNSISVPANTTDVLVRVAVTDDALVEGTENITLAVKGQYDSAFTAPVSGNIVDNDTQGITIVGAGNGTGTGDTVVFEGSAAVFTVKLDAAASSDTTVKLSLTTAGGAGQASAGDVGALEYFNGSSWTPVVNGQVTIPAGSTSVQVRVPTTVDSVFEGAENFTLNATVTGVGAASGTGTIVDDGRTGPTPPTGTPDDDRPHVSITGVSDGKEAGQVGIVYSLKLDHMSTTATTVTLDLKNGSATLGTDTGAVEVSFDGGKTYVAVSGNSISVPANTTDVLVRVAVTDDALVEGTENITLAVKGQYDSAFTAPVSGNIVDNDAANKPTITLDANISADDIINAAEAAQTIAVTGRVGGDAKVGDTVTLTINNKTFTGLVTTGNVFSINVPGSDLAADADRTIDAAVTTTDAAGNTGSASDTEGYAVDTAAPTVVVDIVSGSLKAGQTSEVTFTFSEKVMGFDASDLTVTGGAISGMVTADGGKTWTATFTPTVGFEGTGSVAVKDKSYTDLAGNAGGPGSDNVPVDTKAPVPTITLDANITADDIINAAEAAQTIVVTGRVGGDAKVGDTVTLTINNKTFTGLVTTGNVFSINVPGADLAADADRTIDASVTTTDAAGNTGSASDTEGYAVNLNVPTVSNGSATVSEEGLSNGLKDTSGTSDTTDLVSRSGTIAMADADGNSLSVTLLQPTEALTSNGQAITWSGNGTQTLVGSVGGTVIATITINNSGQYNVTLSGPIDHANAGVEDVKSFNVGVRASDGVNIGSGTLTVNVEDDAPVSVSQTVDVQMPYISTNLVLTLDISASMTDSSGISGKTRLQVAKEALTQLINDYDNVGDVKVMLVTFSSNATVRGNSTWISATEAKTLLAGLTAGGNTDYDAALQQVTSRFDDAGKLQGGQNVAYFFSDGVPTENNGTGSNGIVGSEITAWTNFLNSKDINSLAIGLGSGVSGSNLDPIAYNGAGTGSEANSIIVTDLSQLPPILRDTVLTPSSGQIAVSGSASSLFGADGGHINDVSVDGFKFTFDTSSNSILTSAPGTKFTFDAVTHVLKINTALGGLFVVDMDDGKYTYTPPTNLTANAQEKFGYTLIDNDGDKDTSNSVLTLNVIPPRYNTAPIAVDDYTYARVGQAVTFNVMGNDTDLQGDKLSISGVPTASNGTVKVNADGSLTFTPTAGFVGTAKVTYTISDGYGGFDTADWYIQVVPAKDVIGGSDLNDQITVMWGESQAGKTIYASLQAGDSVKDMYGNVVSKPTASLVDTESTSQVFFAGASNDHVEGGAGNDLIYMGETLPNSANPSVTQATLLGLTVMTTDSESALVDTSNTSLTSISTPTQNIADYSNAGSGDDVVFGEGGTDVLYGNSGDDKLFGGLDNDALRGGDGKDLLVGGAGNDVLRGDAGSDVFKWTLGDQGTAGAPARDIIMDFNNAKSGNAAGEVDSLDLRDLLQGENSGTLTQYLHFEKSGSDTIVHISSKGEFSGSNWTTKEDQVITLQGVDLTTAGNDQAIIADLLKNGKLITD